MWVGYSSSMAIDDSETQTIRYLPQINSSPMSYSVVRETLSQVSRIAKEFNQMEIVCTYDLAIAKMAKQIKAAENPNFYNIFINLGGFHLQLAFFKALGKYIDGSGITEILVASEFLTEGSVNSFLDGKNFNRCKRIHPYVVGAMQIFHFERFMEENSFDKDLLIADIETTLINPCEPRGLLDIPPYMRKVLNEYRMYRTSTLACVHGKTAQFYMQYVQMVESYFRFSRSIRSSDIERCIDSVYEIVNLFSIFNQPNYARWSVSYASDLLKLLSTDLTLEQTVNADAGNSLTGISHFTNYIRKTKMGAQSWHKNNYHFKVDGIR